MLAVNPIAVELNQLIQLRYYSNHINLSHAFSRHKKSLSALAGQHFSPFKGRGLDFDEVRPYQAGDDPRSIDWNVTARTNKVHSKVFKEERERTVFLIVDFNPSMYFATRGMLKTVMASQIAALMAWAGADNHYRVGGLVFCGQQQLEIKPRGGHKGVLQLLKLLEHSHATWFAQGKQPPDYQATNVTLLFKRLKKIVQSGSLLVFASDFQFMPKQQLETLHYLSQHNDVVASFVYDVMEKQLPPAGQYTLTDGQRLQILNTDHRGYRQQYQQHFIQQQQHLAQQCQQYGLHFMPVATHESVVDVLNNTIGKPSSNQRVAKHRA